MKGSQYFPFDRNHYYYGKFLSADVLDGEQKYMNDKRRFLNRFLHGSGVIFGMAVMAADDQTIAVQPGAALDFAGREIVIDQPMLLPLASLDGSVDPDAAVLYLCLEYAEFPRMSETSSGSSGQYDLISEQYHFFLTASEPLHSAGTAQRFYLQTEEIYAGEGYRIQQQLPVMVQAGGEAMLTVCVQRRQRNAAVQFSYQIRLTGMKYGEDRMIAVSYDSRTQPMTEERAVLQFPLHVLLHAAGEKASAETVQGSFSSGSELYAAGFSVCTMYTEIVLGELQEHVLQRFRDTGMEQIRQDNAHQPPICLAACYMTEKNGRSGIDHIERMPFAQYVSSDLDSELLAFLTDSRQNRIQPAAAPKTEAGSAEKLLHQYTVSSGIAEIPMPMGGRAGQCFYSEPISHGLGIGKTAVTLGLLVSDTEMLLGDTEVFAQSGQGVSASLGAKLNPVQGTFVIGVRLREPTAAARLQIHWTAVRSHTPEVTGTHPRMMIRPDLVSLSVLENITFEVRFEQMPRQPVQWCIAEGARGGVITDGGSYTAPNTPGVYQILAKAVESGMQASAFVSVRDTKNS